MMYKEVFQEVLLYRRKICVLTDAMMKVLEGFCHSIARRIEGMTVRRGYGGELKWASVEEVLEAVGIWAMG